MHILIEFYKNTSLQQNFNNNSISKYIHRIKNSNTNQNFVTIDFYRRKILYHYQYYIILQVKLLFIFFRFC